AIIDGLGLLDLGIGPGKDFFRRRDRDFHLIESLHGNGRVERVHDVGMVIHLFSPLSARTAATLLIRPEGEWDWKCRIIPPLPEEARVRPRLHWPEPPARGSQVRH